MKHSILTLTAVVALVTSTGCVGVPKTTIKSYEKEGAYVHQWSVTAAPNVDLSGLRVHRVRDGEKITSTIGLKGGSSTNSSQVIDSSAKGTVDIINASGDLVQKGVEAGVKAAAKSVVP